MNPSVVSTIGSRSGARESTIPAGGARRGRCRRRATEGYNVNGRRVAQKGYITDELTDFALDWLKRRDGDAPFFLYLSHKAVHSDFVPADRHRGRYADAKVTFPEPPDQKAGDRPRWLLDQRNSRHGVGFAYNLPDFNLSAYYRRYCEAILPLDESVGRLLAHLERAGVLDDTLVVYMGDNGFQFGEQGLIDKRTAYEASIRVPLLMRWPAGLPAGRTVSEIVANLDIAPTLLAAAGVPAPDNFDGRDALPLARGEEPEHPGGMRSCTNTSGNGTIPRRRRCTRFWPAAGSTSATTASGTPTNFSTWRRTRESARI